jgi:translocation and assembly module TamB
MAPESTQSSPDQTSRSPHPYWQKIVLQGLAGLTLLGAIAGFLGWQYLRQILPDIISEELSSALDRPIHLGELERFDIAGLRFGETIIPPTNDNWNWLRVQEAEISFNPALLLFRQTFRPRLRLVQPEINVRQRRDRAWEIEPPGTASEEGFIRTEIGSIEIRDAQLSIGPLVNVQLFERLPEGIVSSEKIVFENVNIGIYLRGPNNQIFALNMDGQQKTGTFELRSEGDLETRNANFAVQADDMPINQVNPGLGGNLFLADGYLSANLEAQLLPEEAERLTLQGVASLREGEAFILGLPSYFEDIQSRLRFKGQQVTFEETRLQFDTIGIEVSGTASPQAGFDIAVALPEVSLEQVEQAFQQPLPLSAGGTFRLLGQLTGPLAEPTIAGQLTNVSPVTVDRVAFTTAQGRISGNREALTLQDLRLIPQIGGSVTAQGEISFLATELIEEELPPTAIALTANAQLPLDTLTDLYDWNLPDAVRLGTLNAAVQTSGSLIAPTATVNWALQDGTATGQGAIAYANDTLTLRNTILQISEGAITATGQANLLSGALDIVAQANLPLDQMAEDFAVAVPAGLTLGQMQADVGLTGFIQNPRLDARWDLSGGAVPATGRLRYGDQLLAIPDTRLWIGDRPLLAAGEANFITATWQLSLLGSDLALNQVSSQLLGTANVDLQASGQLADLRPAATQATGNVAFSQGIPLALEGAETLLEGPLAIAFDWDGSYLQIPRLTAPGLNVRGQLTTTTPPATDLPEITAWDFDVQLANFDLQALNSLAPSATLPPLQGFLDFVGQLRGTPTQPALQGTVALRDTALGTFSLASDVRGPVAFSPRQGVRLNLTGDDTRLQLETAPDGLPTVLLFENRDVIARANRRGDWLSGEIRHFPLQVLGLQPVREPNLGLLSGMLNSEFAVNLRDLSQPEGRARFAIARPALGHLSAQAFQGQVSLFDQTLRLTDSTLELPNSQFDLTAQIDLQTPIAVAANISTTDARLEDLLAALQLYEWEDLQRGFTVDDFGKAADIGVLAIGQPDAPFPEQMDAARAAHQRQNEWDAAQTQRRLPVLADLTGAVSADIALTAGEAQSPTLDFQIVGQDWAWGTTAFPNQFLAQGNWWDEVLTLDPIRFTAGDAIAQLEGQFAADQLNTQLRLTDFPLAPLARWLESPLPVDGQVNAIAALTGTFYNPTLRGTLATDALQVNDYPLALDTQFQYQNAWLRFDGSLQGTATAPLSLQGQVPYALPFMTVQPSRDQLLIQATLPSDGFAMLNVLSPYVIWQGGEGNLLLEARGPIQSPELVGLLEFQDAAIGSELFPSGMTGLTGRLRLGSDQILSSSLQGNLLDGHFSLMGEVPLVTIADPVASPLILTLEQLQFNFADELVSQIDGYLRLRDSLQTPVLDGEVHLNHAQVRVGRNLVQLAEVVLNDPQIEEFVEELVDEVEAIPGTFDGVTIALDTPAKIQASPLLSLDLLGTTTISGPFAAPTLNGAIAVLDGWINTFTAQFDLVRGYPNTLTFTDSLDPDLDLQFEAFLPQQRRYNAITNPFLTGNNSEIPDIDALQSLTIFEEVQVLATLQGPASQALDNLTLTSSPSLPEQRLLSLVTGGYLTDLPRTEPFLALGSNMLNSLFIDEQEAIAQALGIRRFRLQASTVLPAESGDAFSYGVGLNVGLSDDLSVSLIQILNRNQPYQLNVFYRVNNQVGISGSTDFTDNSRLSLQYRIDF